MAQFVRPIADVDAGSWASTPFWSKIDEDISGGGDDSVVTSDAVSNNVNTSDLDLEGTNTGITDPAVSTGHILRVLWNSSDTDDMTGHFELWQGVPDTGSLIAEATVELTTATEVETTHTLTSGEADAITDYNDLHFALWGRGTGGGPARSLDELAAAINVTFDSHRPRWRRVLTDTAQWRFIALTTDFIVLTLISGELFVAGGAALTLFVIKSFLFGFWRAWRETRL